MAEARAFDLRISSRVPASSTCQCPHRGPFVVGRMVALRSVTSSCVLGHEATSRCNAHFDGDWHVASVMLPGRAALEVTMPAATRPALVGHESTEPCAASQAASWTACRSRDGVGGPRRAARLHSPCARSGCARLHGGCKARSCGACRRGAHLERGFLGGA